MSLLKVWMTAVTFNVNETPDETTLVFGSLPPAMQQTLSDDYQELLKG
jgi:hypothetical protein